MPHVDLLIHSAAQLVTCASPTGPKRGSALAEVGAIADGAVVNTDKPPKLAKTKEHSIDLIVFEGKLNTLDRATFDRALGFGKGSLKVRQSNGTEDLISTTRTCPRCGVGVPEIDPRWFSFNTKQGRCEPCEGTGVEGGAENVDDLFLAGGVDAVDVDGAGLHDVEAARARPRGRGSRPSPG